MVKKIILNKILVDNNKQLCKVIKTNGDMSAIQLLNNKQFINYIDNDIILNEYHDMDLSNEIVFNLFTTAVNRSNGQTNQLLESVYGDYELLILIEEKIKAHSLHYCPSGLFSIIKVLRLPVRSSNYDLSMFKNESVKNPIRRLLWKVIEKVIK